MTEEKVNNSDVDVNSKLEEILEKVKSNDTSLDSCVDLFDEAIDLTNDAIKQIDEAKLFEMDEISKDGLQDTQKN
ncbi:MAG: exodeoxyribonuclease VII small subunit [Coriobacteriales bacterium]|nr:exodeoxyribonuclease VII small subunit [Coriobacteriales bacterium]